MQTARVKGVLRPVHECLYDFISRKPWLVRGDVTKDHVKYVVDDMRDGEKIISGDYRSATDNIYTDVVEAIVRCLAEAPSLNPEERELMIESFRAERLHWRSGSGMSHPIYRGSMMGNLLSFPVLCLLNRATVGLARSLRYRRSGMRYAAKIRPVIINGDDIAFTGDDVDYVNWKRVTSCFGLVVNDEKTGVSPLRLELNSRSFEIRKGPDGRTNLVRSVRKPVLSALMRNDEPGCILGPLFEGLRTLKPDTLWHGIISMKDEITRKGVDLGAVPKRMRGPLLRHAFVRRACLRHVELVQAKRPRVGITSEVGRGEELPTLDRHWPIVKQVMMPPPEHREVFRKLNSELLSIGVDMAAGVKCVPQRLVLRRRYRRSDPVGKSRIDLVYRWYWLWPVPLWNYWKRKKMPLIPVPSSQWADFHECLTASCEVISTVGVPPPLLHQEGWIFSRSDARTVLALW